MKVFLKILWFTIAFLAALIFMEVFLQLASVESIAKTEIDPERGKILKPDQYSVYFNEGFYAGKPNLHGFYGPDFSIEKKDGVFRIALAGDSYIAGTQLFDRFHFRSLLENRLSVISGHKIEVLNFGRAGFDFDDSYCLYKLFIQKFSPDVTLFFVAPKDFENDNKDPLLPSCRTDSIGKIEILTGFENKKQYRQYKKLEFIAGKSALIKMLSNCKKYFDKGESVNIVFDKLAFLFKQEKMSPDEDNVSQSFELSILNRKIFEDLSGKKAVMICRKELPKEVLVSLKDNSIDSYELFKELEKLGDEGTDPYYWKITGKRGHWNHAAHKRVSEYLSEILIKIIREKDGLE
jgi:hypothetical protein